MTEKRTAIVAYLEHHPWSSSNEIARALGYIDGRDVSTMLKVLEREGGVSARVDTSFHVVKRRYRLKEARMTEERG